jgi:hypothetical protein
LLQADTLEDGVSAEAFCDFARALDRLVAAFTHHVGRPELLRERDPVWMTAEENDPLGIEASGGDHSAQPDGAVADHRDSLPRTDLGAESRVMAGSHYVREREQRRHQVVVFADRQNDERAVCLRDPDGLSLAAVDSVVPVPSSVEA